MEVPSTVLTHDRAPLVRGFAQATAALLDPGLSLSDVLQAVADKAREIAGARHAVIELDTDPRPAAEPAVAPDVVLVPLTGPGGGSVGLIRISTGPAGALVQEEEILLSFARLASLAISNARARETLVAQTRLATLGADIGLALNESATLAEMLQHCADAVVRNLDAAFAQIWTPGAGSGALEPQARAGLIPAGRVAIGAIVEVRRPHLTNDAAGDPLLGNPEWAAREGLVAFAAYPLIIAGRLVGVLAASARHRFTDVDAQALAWAAGALALGIERRQAEAARDRALADVAAERRRLEIINRELDQFAYVASHDLRAPLRGIANLAQWIEEDLQGSLREETRDLLALLRSRIYRMEALIDGILEFSRAGRARGRPETVNVGALAGDVIELLAPEPPATVIVEPGMPTMVTERLALQQVFLNLIGNALKHSDRPDARVVIGVGDAGPEYEFFVSDNGPGIPPDYHAKIWGVFQTLEPRDKVEGTGIGLALVKKLVETRGGRVWVESSPGRGATFRFRWPKFMPIEEQR